MALGAVCAAACGSSDDANLGGVPGGPTCTTDQDCPGSAPICDPGSGRCVECTSPAQCTEAGTTCDPVSRQCKQTCSPASSCSDGRLCSAEGVCVRCRADADCAGGGDPLCDAARDRCVECFLGSHCGASEPICDASDGECVQCLSGTDCAPGMSCVDGDCVGPCTNNAQCGGDRPFCDGSSCVECLESAHCTSGGNPFCSANRICVECLEPTDCDSDKICTAAGKCD